MSDRPSHREHMISLAVPVAHYVGISKIMAKYENSKYYAALFVLNEGLFKEGVISREDHDLFAKRYSRKLKDVIAENQIKRESSHTPVLAIEKQKQQPTLKEEELELEEKDKVFKGILDQWDKHNLEWRLKVWKNAEPYKDKLQSARDIIAKAEDAIPEDAIPVKESVT